MENNENNLLSSELRAHRSSKRKALIIFAAILMVCVVASAVYYFVNYYSAGQSDNISLQPSRAIASDFATYHEYPVSINPNVAPYTTDASLSNVENRQFFTDTGDAFSNHENLSEEAKQLLAKNLFVVRPASRRDEFFQLYEQNRYNYIPNFVTTDSLLHNYHIMFDFLLKRTEQNKLMPELQKLNAGMLKTAELQYDILKSGPWENSARRNVAFFAVASKLADPNFEIPPDVKKEVQSELDLINAHQSVAVSPLMSMGQPVSEVEGLKEDYSQYIPRGHYDSSDALRAYFKTMMWYGRLTFRFKSIDETRSALLITLAMRDSDNASRWEKIYSPTNFFVGESDDITYLQLQQVVERVYGAESSMAAITADQSKFEAFRAAAQELPKPQINSIPIFDKSINPDREKEIAGFRFMGQRFTLDASIFQKLVYRDVEQNDAGERRMLPNVLDVPAALGSKEALSILENKGDTKFSGYSENMSQLRSYIGGLNQAAWTQNLYWGWLFSLRPLLEPVGAGYPSFMTNTAWLRSQLNTFAGSFTELKHDTLLYAKQVYAEMGGGGEVDKFDDRGYVEPNPYVYSRLASLLRMTMEGLKDRDLLTQQSEDSLTKMHDLALSLKTISEKELNGTQLTDDEYDLIRSYGGQLEHFWLEANKEDIEKSGLGESTYLSQNPAAIVADIATDPANGKVLQEATGSIQEILVVVPIEGKLRIASGTVFSHYEFPWPLNDRLTDQKWRDIVAGDAAAVPPLSDWVSIFREPLK